MQTVKGISIGDVIAYCPVQCQFEFPVIAKWTDQAVAEIMVPRRDNDSARSSDRGDGRHLQRLVPDLIGRHILCARHIHSVCLLDIIYLVKSITGAQHRIDTHLVRRMRIRVQQIHHKTYRILAGP